MSTTAIYRNTDVGVDGYVSNSGTVYSTVHDALAGETVNKTIDYGNFSWNYYSDPTYTIVRAFFTFNTAGIPDDAVIESATLSIYMDTITNADTTSLNIVQSTQASNTDLVVGDFDACGTTVGGSLALADITNSAVNVITFNSTGLGFINKTGYTALCIRISNDVTNNTPTGINRAQNALYTEYTGSQLLRPTLTVKYTLLKSFNGLAKASIKSINGLAIGSVKSVNGLA